MHEKKIVKDTKYCNYYGNNEELCEMQTPSDPNLKACILINNICRERYKYCSDYKGSSSEKCTEIIPFDPETGKKEYFSKCSWDNKICVKKPKLCYEYIGHDPAICAKYHAEDENKKCALKGNQCSEQYKICETYKGTDRNICEKIILSDFSKECVFQPRSGAQPSKCETKAKTCSQLNLDYLGNYCENHSLNNYKKKCSFNYNGFGITGTCSVHTNSCDEITFANESEAAEEKCNEITVDQGYICTLRRDKTGCRNILKDELEEEKEIEQGKNQQGGNTDNSGNTGNIDNSGNTDNTEENSAGKRYQTILGLLLFLLLL